jgi:hypothetical protein
MPLLCCRVEDNPCAAGSTILCAAGSTHSCACIYFPSASCAAGWTTAVAFASSPCHCAAGSTMLVLLSEIFFLCCRVDDSLCCRVDDSLCCRVNTRLSVLQGRPIPVLQGRGDLGQCSSDDAEATLAVLQGGIIPVLQGRHIHCATGSTTPKAPSLPMPMPMPMPPDADPTSSVLQGRPLRCRSTSSVLQGG